jgi:uncharacterized Zn-binding protein involved in type VI secretion
MTGNPLVEQGATVTCGHKTGRAEPLAVNGRVTLGGRAAVLLAAPWRVSGCTQPPQTRCVTAAWITGSTRVTSSGAPLVVQGGTAVCAPSPVALQVTAVQPRVVVM